MVLLDAWLKEIHAWGRKIHLPYEAGCIDPQVRAGDDRDRSKMLKREKNNPINPKKKGIKVTGGDKFMIRKREDNGFKKSKHDALC